MKYGDFSSLVQLGIGLHLGTALLQMYGELGVAPLVRTIDRVRSLYLVPEGEQPPKSLKEELERLESKYEIFKIRLFQEYRRYVAINSVVAIMLTVALVALAFLAQKDIDMTSIWIVVLLAALSLLPAPATLGALWIDANRQVRPMKSEADDLERRTLAS